MSKNKVIGIYYSLKDGKTNEPLDSNIDGEVLEFITNMGHIIEGLEKKVIDMKIGEKAEVLITPEEGYGEYSLEAVQTLPKEQFAGVDLEENMILYGQGEHGEQVQVVVKSFDDNEVKVDYNHPMAGKKLLFSVEVASSRDATDDEISSGVVGGAKAHGSCGCGSHDGGCGSH